MIILGLKTRVALVVGGLMMTSLTCGTMFLGDFNPAWLQLTFAIAFFILLAMRSPIRLAPERAIMSEM